MPERKVLYSLSHRGRARVGAYNIRWLSFPPSAPPNGRGVFVQPPLKTDFLDKPSFSKTNPLSPCSLLGAFRLAARLNDSWYKLTDGKFDIDGRPELVQYEGELRDGKTLKTVTPRAAEIIAAVFAAEILRANEITSLLTENCTEADCLDEIFQPATLRLNLKRQGIEVPLR